MPDLCVTNPSDERFWLPENWPLGKAPCRHEVRRSMNRYRKQGDPTFNFTVSVSLWTKYHDGEIHLDYESRIGTTASNIPAFLDAATRRLKQRRDEELAGGLGVATRVLLAATDPSGGE